MIKVDFYVIISFITLFILIIIPIIITIVLSKKNKIHLNIFFIGVLGFFVSQELLRFPLLRFLNNYSSKFYYFTLSMLGTILIGGFTAALFEETARLVCGKILIKNKITFKSTISYAIGHSFCEILVLPGFKFIKFFIMSVELKSGILAQKVADGIIDSNSISMYENILSSISVRYSLIIILERIIVLGFHIFATTLVFKAINEKKYIWYIAAIFLHTDFNGLMAFTIPTLYLEGIWAVFSLLGILAVMKMKKSFPEPGAAAVLTPEEELTM